jgi:hypothetical protein
MFLHPLGVARFAAAADYFYFATDSFTSCADDFVSAIVGFAAMAEYFIVSVTTLTSWRQMLLRQLSFYPCLPALPSIDGPSAPPRSALPPCMADYFIYNIAGYSLISKRA